MLDPHGYLVGFVTDDRWRCHHCGERDRVEPVAIPTSQYLFADGLPRLEAHTARARCSRCGTRADLHLVPAH
ncbi:MAG TPA: hypothetical protein DGT23_06425 [Micromonosporaceae bacterium]|nr:hypothetical protein [Micromonosporaceae bacterium]